MATYMYVRMYIHVCTYVHTCHDTVISVNEVSTLAFTITGAGSKSKNLEWKYYVTHKRPVQLMSKLTHV